MWPRSSSSFDFMLNYDKSIYLFTYQKHFLFFSLALQLENLCLKNIRLQWVEFTLVWRVLLCFFNTIANWPWNLYFRFHLYQIFWIFDQQKPDLNNLLITIFLMDRVTAVFFIPCLNKNYFLFWFPNQNNLRLYTMLK